MCLFTILDSGILRVDRSQATRSFCPPKNPIVAVGSLDRDYRIPRSFPRARTTLLFHQSHRPLSSPFLLLHTQRPSFPSFSSLSLSLFLSLRKSLPIVPPSFLLTLPHGSGKLTFSDTFLPPLRLPGAVRLSHVLCKRPLLLSAPVQWLFLLWARARSNFQSHFASCASTSPPDAIASPRARLVLSPAHSAIANHPQPPPLLLFLFP